jgi:RNA polymerase sigma-70 factor (ECF subfamily)
MLTFFNTDVLMAKHVENEVLEKLRKGGETAFKEVYDENRDKFLLYARKYGLDDDERLDVYQDTYIVFYQNVITGRLKELTSALSTYLFGIGKNLIMKTLKKNQRTVRSEYMLSIAKDEDVAIDNMDWDESLSHEQKLLMTYFVTLGEQCQKLLTMFYYRGFSIKEIIAEGNYNNANVVKSQKSRCLKTLRERILKPQPL